MFLPARSLPAGQSASWLATPLPVGIATVAALALFLLSLLVMCGLQTKRALRVLVCVLLAVSAVHLAADPLYDVTEAILLLMGAALAVLWLEEGTAGLGLDLLLRFAGCGRKNRKPGFRV